MREYEKMEKGLWHDANNDEELLQKREEADVLCHRFNHTSPNDVIQKKHLLMQLLPHAHQTVTILSPFYTDYGDHCFIKEKTFINRHAYLMDGGGIHIGAHCFIGPNCSIYTALHPLNRQQRNQGYEKALGVVIEDHVWIGGDVTILPGVTIHEGAVIGAKSLVTKDIPAYTLAFGNPCKPIRQITESDRCKIVDDE